MIYTSSEVALKSEVRAVDGILSMFDEKNPPKTLPICDILTGTTKSSLGHLLHAVFWNKTNLVEKKICFVLHTRLKSYDNCHGFL